MTFLKNIIDLVLLYFNYIILLHIIQLKNNEIKLTKSLKMFNLIQIIIIIISIYINMEQYTEKTKKMKWSRW